MNRRSDFVIQDGILLEYRGTARLVRVPAGVRGIPSSVFQGSNVRELLLPEGLVWIGKRALSNCRWLRRLVLPGTLRAVPPDFCSDCPALKEVVIPEGVVWLGDRAFQESGLTQVTIPDSVRSIGDSCFADCMRLEKASLGRNVQHLKLNAFAVCVNLQTISLPASVHTVESWAFQYCASLRSVHMEPRIGALSVGDFSFQNCPGLSEVVFPDALEDIQDDTFGEDPVTGRVTFQGNRMDIRGLCQFCLATIIRAPQMRPEWFPVAYRPAALAGFREMQAEGYPLEPGIVEAWEAFAAGADPDVPKNPAEPFRIADGILSRVACPEGRVVVPDGVTGIRAEAFRGTAVREVVLPDSVRWIHTGTFQGCDRLKAVRLPAGLTRIPEYLCYACQELKSIRIPDGVKRIGGGAFEDSGLEAITLPPSLETIEAGAFSGCRQLKQIRFSEGLREIQQEAFANCCSLTEVSLPASLEFLEEGAFMGCTALKRVSIGAGLSRVACNTFQGCSALEEASIAADLLFLEDDCFSECSEFLRLRLECSFVEPESEWPPSRIVAPNADPTIHDEAILPSLLLGFAAEDGKGFRYGAEYLELLRFHRRELWNFEPVLRFLLRHDMLEREDIPDCLKILQEWEARGLIAELLEYSHRRFPEPAAPMFLD